MTSPPPPPSDGERPPPRYVKPWHWNPPWLDRIFGALFPWAALAFAAGVGIVHEGVTRFDGLALVLIVLTTLLWVRRRRRERRGPDEA